MSNLILISIKEQYVKEILSGTKTIELRKSVPKASAGDTIIIYTTQPKKAVTAIALVNKILITSPEEMWDNHNSKLGIDKKSFDDYYKNYKKAVGIELKEVFKLDAEILLSAIKLIHPHFSPPQTFKYLNKFATLRDFKNLVS
jgi:predicted transcriptional regulator